MTDYEAQWAAGTLQEVATASTPGAASTSPEDSTAAAGQRPPTTWGDPNFYEWRDGWRWWCRICKMYADGGHVQGSRHLKRVEWADWCNKQGNEFEGPLRRLGEEDEDEEAEASVIRKKPVLDPWGPDWEASRKSEPSSGSAAAPARVGSASASSSAPPALEAVPPPWKKVWSDEWRKEYYWNMDTDETVWDTPKWDNGWL